jgi:hypothetical protein
VNLGQVARTAKGSRFVFRGVKNKGETYTSSGICQDGKSLAF